MLVILFVQSCDSHVGNSQSLSLQNQTADINPVGISIGKWFALGDSDFDSYQADDLKFRVNKNAANAPCVLSPTEVQAKDGRDFGEYAEWGDGRRHDYRANFSLSGASVRNDIFAWREHLAEDTKSGIVEMIREVRDSFLGREPRLGNAIISELSNIKGHKTPLAMPVVMQINIGINDINGYGESMYEKFTSQDSHFSWIGRRTGAIKKVVDEMLEIHPNVVIVLWQLLDDSRWNAK